MYEWLRPGFREQQRGIPPPAGHDPDAELPEDIRARLAQRPEGMNPDEWREIVLQPHSVTGLNYNLLQNISRQTAFDTGSWNRLMQHFNQSRTRGLGLLEGAGESSKAEAARISTRTSGEINQDLMDRGFYNSSLKDMYQQREKESLARTNAAIDEGVRAQRLGFDTQWATTMGQTMAAKPNPYAPLADIYRLALLTKLTPKGAAPNFSGVGAGVGTGLGALVGSLVPGVGTMAGATIGGGLGGAAGSFIR